MTEKNTSPAYMFVFRFPQNEPDPSPEEMQRVFEKWRSWIGGMRAKGIYLGGDRLEESPATTLRGPRGSKGADGPFAEAKEIVAGYVMLSAKDFAEAVELARGCPAFDLPGRSVEVRQIMPTLM